MINLTLTKFTLGMIGALLLSSTLSAKPAKIKTIAATSDHQTKRYLTHEADCNWIPAGEACIMDWIAPSPEETFSAAYCEVVDQLTLRGNPKKVKIRAKIVVKTTLLPVPHRQVICENRSSSWVYIKARAVTIFK